ncbi:hypothetical protein [Bradyrhizobium sp. 160]|uniref:hypothetical protein n=1 Tax=Bradyrhizobium sp. 160 TaxID=2782634 RepID=UPI001FFAA9BB|nr:hypothetical protein [Bradyrhizobium sp. 160]
MFLTTTRVLSGLDFIALSGARNIVLSSTVVVRTSLQNRLGGYLADLPYASGMEMWLRPAAHGDVGVIAADQAVYRAHAGNMSSEPSREQDLLQRKPAIEHFLNNSAARLTNADHLRARLHHVLALEAVGRASAAFSERAMESSADLSRLVVSFDPNVQRTRRWWWLACKRVLGLRGWQRVRPAVEWLISVSRNARR